MSNTNHFYAKVDSHVKSNVDGFNTIVAERGMKHVNIEFAVGTKGYDKIKQSKVPKRIVVLTNDEGKAYDFIESNTDTPPMLHHTKSKEVKQDMLHCINHKMSLPQIAVKLNLSEKHTNYFYREVLVENSKRAVHNIYGRVRVFISMAYNCYFILHPELSLILGAEHFEVHNFKCLPLFCEKALKNSN